MASRHPLPYAFARSHTVLLEDDGQHLTLWAAPEVSLATLSEVQRLYQVDRLESQPQALLAERISETIQKAGHVEGLSEHANALAQALQKVGATTKAAWSTGVPEEALANATPYLQAFGHTVLAWVWLELALAAKAAQAQGQWDTSPLGPGFLKGKLACTDYFFRFELPKIDAWLGVVARRDLTCAQAQADWF